MNRYFPAMLLVGVVCLALGCGGEGSNLHAGPMPTGGTWSGVWQSPQYGEMHICQTGANVTGDYIKNERHGTLQGTVQGDLLRFSWEERRELVQGRPGVSRGHGYFHYTIGQDGDHYFQGEWGIDDAHDGGGPWNGVRMRNGQPTRCMGSHGGEQTDDSNANDDSDYNDDSSDSSSSSGGTPPQEDALSGLDEY